MSRLPSPTRPLLVAAIVLGVGFAAFFDGIVLHQLLNWHHMICQERSCHPLSIADLQQKNVADGWFHLGAFFATVAGAVLLYRAGGMQAVPRAANTLFVGGLLAGMGGFNLVEGVIDHHILQIHHVRFGPNRDIYDVTFLAISALLLGAGTGLIRRAKRENPRGESVATSPAGSLSPVVPVSTPHHHVQGETNA